MESQKSAPALDAQASSSTPYVHSPLSKPTNIRLLYVEPGAKQDRIVLSLFGASLEHSDAELPLLRRTDPPTVAYQALSYVWGDARDKQPIEVDGKAFKITTNLYEFLIHARGEQ